MRSSISSSFPVRARATPFTHPPCTHSAPARRLFLQRVASSIVADEGEEKDRELVQSLLDFRERADALVAGAFAGSDSFKTVLRAALDTAVNSRENKPSELIGV